MLPSRQLLPPVSRLVPSLTTMRRYGAIGGFKLSPDFFMKKPYYNLFHYSNLGQVGQEEGSGVSYWLVYGHSMSELAQPQTGKILPIASIVTFIGFLDTYLLIPVMALYATELGAGVGTVGLIVGLYSLTNTPANILFGRLIDRVGYKIPLILGLIGDALSMFLYSICRLPVHMALVRILHGVAGAAIGPATMSVMAGYSKLLQRGRTMSFYGASMGLATLVGFILSGMLASQLGYKAVFLFGVALLTIGAILGLFLPSDISRGNNKIISSVSGLAKVKELIRKRGLVIAYCSIFAQFFTFGSVVTMLPLYVKSLGMGASHVGMSLTAFAIMFVILQFPSGVISDKVGRLLSVAIGLIFGMVSLVILSLVEVFSLLMLVMALYGVAFGILFPSISALVADHTTPEERGLATGMYHALLTAGVATGAPIMGWVGGMVGVELGLKFSSGIMALALVVVLGIRKR